jgi:hypothetical protein
MKLIDEKGKMFGKINAIDLGIIVLILVLCFGTYYKFFKLENTSVSKAMEPIKYDVKIQGCRVYLKDAIKNGDTLYDKTSGNAIGTIVEVKAEPAKQDLQLLNGTYKECEIPSRFDLTLTVEAQGSENKVNRVYELVVNSTKNFKTKYANATGKVSKIY